MDAKRIIYDEDALEDLIRIEAYIAAENPQAATRVIRSIRTRIAQLEEFPNIGAPEKRGHGRLLIETRYRHKIVYGVAGDTVQIRRILGSKQETPRNSR